MSLLKVAALSLCGGMVESEQHDRPEDVPRRLQFLDSTSDGNLHVMDTAGVACPDGYRTPSTEAACQQAATLLGLSFANSGHWDNHVGGPGCHVGGLVGWTNHNGNVHFNQYPQACDGCHGFRICELQQQTEGHALAERSVALAPLSVSAESP